MTPAELVDALDNIGREPHGRVERICALAADRLRALEAEIAHLSETTKHYVAPSIERVRNEVDSTFRQKWSLSGDWSRDLPLDIRHMAAEELRGACIYVDLDLRGLGYVDEWGTATIVDFILARERSGGHVYCETDGNHAGEEIVRISKMRT